MWLIIDPNITDPAGRGAVIGTSSVEPPSSAFPAHFLIKEWGGVEPLVHDPEDGIESYDPTVDDPGYLAFLQSRLDFDALFASADNEIAWLDSTIPNISTMTAVEVRAVVERLARENREMIKAWRYLFNRL